MHTKKQFSFSSAEGMYYSLNDSGLHDVIIADYVIGNDDAPGCKLRSILQREFLLHTHKLHLVWNTSYKHLAKAAVILLKTTSGLCAAFTAVCIPLAE